MNKIIKLKGPPEKSDAEKAVEQWKIKKLIKTLTAARGNGTSMISLIVPPKDQVSRVNKMLGDEMGTASNIKSRVNRLSVLGAIVSVQQRLKLYSKVPPNGLVVYCGTVMNDEGKEKKLAIDFEPFKPINTSLYLCDNKFHTEALQELLESDEKYGFIIMDGNGCLCGTLAGNHRVVLHKFSVDLPKKHGRGGQSAARFARLRLEKRQNYITKCCELAVQMFITNDKCNVDGLVLAGNADFKNRLAQSDRFDLRLQAKIIKIVDVSYGGANGFSQAIELSADALANQKFIAEKKLLSKYFGEIAQNTNKYCFGVKDTLESIAAVEELIVWENLDMDRFELRHPTTQEEKIKHLSSEQQADTKHFLAADGAEYEVMEKKPLLEWLTENYTDFGCKLSFITDKSQEGAQFCQGFGGIGGLLRYQMEMPDWSSAEDDVYDSDEDAFGL